MASHGSDGAVLTRAAVLGAATGLRSTIAIGALSVRGRSTGLGPVLVHPLAPRLGLAAVGVELVLDKLPMTGSRLEPVGLIARGLFAGAAGVALARSFDRSPIAPAIVAVATALAAAKIGHDVRVAAATHLPDPVVALLEDGIAISLAAVATA